LKLKLSLHCEFFRGPNEGPKRGNLQEIEEEKRKKKKEKGNEARTYPASPLVCPGCFTLQDRQDALVCSHLFVFALGCPCQVYSLVIFVYMSLFSW
jgi:hypothetical protein